MENEDEEFLNQDDVLEVIELREQTTNGAAGGDHMDDSDGEADTADNVAADAAVASETSDTSLITFSRHAGDVFSIDIGLGYAASGGEDDHAYVWKLEDGTIALECSGHSDSVTYVRFNARKTLLATADMAGLIQVWRMDDFTRSAQLQVGDLSWLRWHQAADILFCGDEDGSMWMYLVPNGDCKVYAGCGHPCSAGELFPDGKRLCAGYGDGGVRIWDLKTSGFTTVDGAAVHRSPVTCVDVSQDNALAASGAENGTVNLIHGSSGKIITTFVCTNRSNATSQLQRRRDDHAESSEMEEAEESISVEVVAFSKNSPTLFTGTVKGELAVWDLNSHVVRQTFPSQEGVVKAIWVDHCVLVADLGGAMRLFDTRNGEIVSQWTGHQGAILDFNLSTDGKTLVSSSADQTCKVFRLDGQT